MSKAGKVLIIFGALFFGALYVFRLAYGGWHESMWVPLILGSVLFFGGLIRERRPLVEFFTMRTTKHGLNMGAVLLIALVGLTCLNVLSVRYNKKLDLTSDKLNSLSDQSLKAARSLKSEVTFVLLYRPDQQGGDSAPKAVKDLIRLYQNENPALIYKTVNAIVDPATAAKYDYSAGAYALFAVQGDRKLKVDQPTEEGVTRALIKLSHPGKKAIYFIAGHGERDLDAKEADGLSFFKEQLSVSYDVRSLTLYQSGNKIPEDAAAVLIVRPTQQFLEPELKAIREYVQSRSGRLLIAIDPGMKHNLAGLVKTFGIEFNNDYVIDLRAKDVQLGPSAALGTSFPARSEITKAFLESSFAIFQIASSLRKALDAPSNAKIEALLATDDKTMSTSELGEVRYKPNGPHTLAMVAQSGKSEVLVFGDSDFLSNAFIQRNLNNDLALNSVAELADDKDLISIRPRMAKATSLDMTRTDYDLYLVLFLLPLPILLFGAGGFIWYRRRTA